MAGGPEFGERFYLIDGGMGTELQKRGLKAGEAPELLCLTSPETVLDIHRAYSAAGADIITANSFGANARKLAGKADAGEVVRAAVKLAKSAGSPFAALDLGPIGALLEPFGQLGFGEAYELFKEQVIAGAEAGADLVLIETMSDLLEAKAALLAVRENSSLPVIVTMTFAGDGRTFLGTSPREAAVTLTALGADAIGVNCSLGPEQVEPFARELLEWSALPIAVQPNAGLPELRNGESVYTVTPEDFAVSLGRMLDMGVTIVGGCCGTTPRHIARLREELAGRTPVHRTVTRRTAFSSGQRTVTLEGAGVAVAGERINPTGKRKIKDALRSGDFDTILGEAISQEEAGAQVLDVNAGLPEIDEPATLERLVRELQGVTALPLMLDSSDPAALERALRVVNGNPVVNSVNGKRESIETVLPLVKKYGAAVVGLTLDENGIPETAEERVSIAERIAEAADGYGIPRENLLIDCLTMTVSTNQRQARETLRAVGLVTERLGLRTVLGVSNVSFGLPSRETLNAAFLGAALGRGLSMPILNPMSKAYMDVIYAHRVISGEDRGAAQYIERYAGAVRAENRETETSGTGDIKALVLSGRKSEVGPAVEAALRERTAMEVVNELLIPAINAAGDRFESGEFFLPQLMASAEAVKAGFETVRRLVPPGSIVSKGKVLLATVKGDIHDIGKNIVKMLLQNYGYEVVDLGRDVPPEDVVRETMRQGIRLVGLSALMTTTVRSMGETIRALHEAGADCKVMVGGAVLNEDYARLVGADYYARDAAESARIAGEVLGADEGRALQERRVRGEDNGNES